MTQHATRESLSPVFHIVRLLMIVISTCVALIFLAGVATPTETAVMAVVSTLVAIIATFRLAYWLCRLDPPPQ